jgi:hypothetical protein
VPKEHIDSFSARASVGGKIGRKTHPRSVMQFFFLYFWVNYNDSDSGMTHLIFCHFCFFFVPLKVGSR